jgi:hypothetical protein
MNDNETLAFRHGSFDPSGTFIYPHMWSGVGATYVDMFHPHIL